MRERSNTRRLVHGAIVFLVVLTLSALGGFDRFDLAVRDQVLRWRAGESASYVALIAIDDASIEEVGRWPWERSTLAALVDRAKDAGASAVAVDLLLLEPAEGDEELARSLDAATGVLPVAIEPPMVRQPPQPLASAALLAHGLLEVDRDGVLRRLASTKQTTEMSFPAISAAMAIEIASTSAYGSERSPIPVGRELVPGFAVRPGDVPTLPAVELLRHDTVARLDGRAVFIGVTAAGLGDRVVTPVTARGRLDAGVAVHAAITEAIASGDLLRASPPWMDALLAAALWFGISLTGGLGGPRRAFMQLGLGLLPLLSGTAALLTIRWAVPAVTLTVVAVAAVLLLEGGTLLRVQRVVEGVSGAGSSPLERVASLERLAREVSDARAHEVESRRVMAHELKTPLTSIRGLAQLLAQYQLSEGETRRVASMVAEESSRLKEMVEGLLDLEKLALRNRDDQPSGVVDVRSMIERRAELARAAGSHTVDVDVDEELAVAGDAGLLERVVENLIGNAMKFSAPGTTITLRGRRARAEAVVEVEDDGPGVPEGERSVIFKRFGRGSSSKGRSGLGLGLAFVAEIAEWHGGRASVTNGAAGGALFRVYLPLAHPEGAEEVS